jgi:SPP1 family predicted phage head-tail adaptor
MVARVGQLNKRVTLQQLVAASPDQFASGEPDETWADFATLYAAVEPLPAGSAKEGVIADQMQFSSSVRVTIRYLDGVHRAMRVLFKSKIYNIGEVVNVNEGGVFLELMCTEGVNEG